MPLSSCKKSLIILFLAFLPAVVYAESDPKKITVDLAGGGDTFSVKSGEELAVTIINVLPGCSYSFEALSEPIVVPEIDLSAFDQAKAETPDLAAKSKNSCQDHVKNLVEDIFKAKSEAQLRTLTTKASLHVSTMSGTAAENKTCSDLIDSVIAMATHRQLPGPYLLGDDQLLTIKVQRQNEPCTPKEWVFKYATGEQRRWLVHYGFAFLPSQDDNFFAKPIDIEGDEDGGFQITEQADQDDNDFEPVVTFTYIPNSLKRRPWVPKFTAGVGADLEETLVFAGLSWVIGDNVNLFVGAAGHKQQRLQGIYEPGQILQATVAPDQLVEDTFDFNAIFGVGIRFNGNPFKKKEPASSGGGDNNTSTTTTTSNTTTTNTTQTTPDSSGATDNTEAGNDGAESPPQPDSGS